MLLTAVLLPHWHSHHQHLMDIVNGASAQKKKSVQDSKDDNQSVQVFSIEIKI